MTGAESYWVASTDDSNYTALEGDLEVDVAVVGAGITGLTTALLLQGTGRSVVVLEANSTIGRGVTGSTTGKITAGQGAVYSRIEKAHGRGAAAVYAASQSAAVEQVRALAAEHEIDCDLERVTHYVFGEHVGDVARLEEEAEAARRAGLEVDLVRDPNVPFPAVVALGLPDQAQFHARKYLLGLARAVVRAGGRIHQGARVTRVEEGAPRVIRLPGGTVSATDVVLATHVPFGKTGSFFARLEAHAAYAVAVPVPDDMLDGAWINVSTPIRSLRTTPLGNGRRLLIVVGEGHVVGRESDPQARYDALADYVDLHITTEDVLYRWSTQDQYPVDGLPYIGPLERGLHVATGFAGWGLSNGTLSAMLITDAIAGRANEWASVFDPRRSSALRAPGSFVAQNLGVAKELVGGKLRDRRSSLTSLEDVAPGTGAIVELDAGKAAVYRSEAGVVTAVSPVCTHMGCDVRWNQAETTWDCPCHGSRFTVDGSVVEGPAVRPLAPVEVGAPVVAI
jgi:glycine/D-amino acid oxidase-like deaminating enzyme/nitrite reductase/ring-hydroxylating ferredoxin subunit